MAGEQSAKAAVEKMQLDAYDDGNRLERLEVSANMYEELEKECAPQTPSEYFGIPITILKQDLH